MTLGELVDRVREVLAVSAADAMSVAAELWTDDRDYTNREIAYVASKLGVGPSDEDEPAPATVAETLHMEMDPAKVLALMYAACPRVLTHETPRVGKAPKESPFYRDDVAREQLIDELPEDTKLLIGNVDVFNGLLSFTVYDEANDLDREVGPLDLTCYPSGRELDAAIRVLLSRLGSRVLPADLN